MHDSWLFPILLLLGSTVVIVLVQSWRLGRLRETAQLQRAIAQANLAAATREQERQAAGYARTFRAAEGERGAHALFERAGYRVIDRQVAGSWSLLADGAPVTFGLRADYLVARNGRRYIAEVKTGRVAPRLSHGPTRRQLLEYRAAFDVHGVILVDADAQTIVHVEMDMFMDDPVDVETSASFRARNGVTRAASSGIRPGVVILAIAISFSMGIVAGTMIGS